MARARKNQKDLQSALPARLRRLMKKAQIDEVKLLQDIYRIATSPSYRPQDRLQAARLMTDLMLIANEGQPVGRSARRLVIQIVDADESAQSEEQDDGDTQDS